MAPGRRQSADGRPSPLTSIKRTQRSEEIRRQIENAISRPQIGQREESLLPSAILAVREEPGDEVVAIGNRREERSNVSLFA